MQSFSLDIYYLFVNLHSLGGMLKYVSSIYLFDIKSAVLNLLSIKIKGKDYITPLLSFLLSNWLPQAMNYEVSDAGAMASDGWMYCIYWLVQYINRLDPQAGWPGRYINVWPCRWLSSMVLMQLKDPLELFVKRREFLPGSGFLSRRDMT